MDGAACSSRGRNRTKHGLIDDDGDSDGGGDDEERYIQLVAIRQKCGSLCNGYLWSYMTLRHMMKVTRMSIWRPPK